MPCKRWRRQKAGGLRWGGAISAACYAPLRHIIETFNLPVVSSLMGLGAFPATHRQSLECWECMALMKPI